MVICCFGGFLSAHNNTFVYSSGAFVCHGETGPISKLHTAALLMCFDKLGCFISMFPIISLIATFSTISCLSSLTHTHTHTFRKIHLPLLIKSAWKQTFTSPGQGGLIASVSRCLQVRSQAEEELHLWTSCGAPEQNKRLLRDLLHLSGSNRETSSSFCSPVKRGRRRSFQQKHLIGNSEFLVSPGVHLILTMFVQTKWDRPTL